MKDYGLGNDTLKIGIDIKDGTKFDNSANPYFVYRASIVDNKHQSKYNLNLYSCKATNNPYYDEQFHSNAYCVDTGF